MSHFHSSFSGVLQTRLRFGLSLLFALIINGTLPLPVESDDGLKRSLEHSDYDVWNTISGTTVSHDGKWVFYAINSGKPESDATLVIRQLASSKQYTIVRGSSPTFSFDSRFAMFRVTPDPAVLKQLRKEKAKPEQIPQTQLQVLELATGESFTAEGISSFSVPKENGRWLAYLLEAPTDTKVIQVGTADILESYEVTEEGLQLPNKPLKLKKREELAPPAAIEKKPAEKEASSSSESKKESEESNTDADQGAAKKSKSTGTFLVLRDLESGLEQRFPDVVQYEFSKSGNALVFATSVPVDEKKTASKTAEKPAEKSAEKKSDEATEPVDAVYVFDLVKQKLNAILSGTGEFKELAFNEKGDRLAFVSNKDDYQAKTPAWTLYQWQSGKRAAEKIADEATPAVPAGWWISSGASLRFSDDDRRLFFATAPIPEAVATERADKANEVAGKKEEEEEPKAVLDLWHWQDPLLQPQQLLQAESERRRDYRAMLDLRSKKIWQLATPDLPVVIIDHRSKTDIAIGTTNLPYRKSLSWDTQGFEDTYLINLKTGKRELVLAESRANARLSPEGKYITWWDAEQLKWFALPTVTPAVDKTKSGSEVRTPIEISAGIGQPLQDELHDTPSLPRPYGTAGWTKDDKLLLVYDRFDIWQLDPTGAQTPVCVTEGLGRQNMIEFRYRQLDPEQRAIDLAQPLLLTAFHQLTKASGFYRLAPIEVAAVKTKSAKTTSAKKSEATIAASESDEAKTPASKLTQLIMLDEKLDGLVKARSADNLLFTRSTFQRCPDLWASNLDFKKISRISDINPQQENYSWGTAELVHWNAADGQALDGLLYKPEGFDPSQKYPMMVYFYERNSDTLHTYYTPAADRSIINHSFYVSRGYLVFVPDIPYKTGEPGPSASNAVLPGVQNLIDQGFVDAQRIGMQGHSWGGYQTAYLVTQTDMFACAESGAPVSNMTSAYGGIRWSSGMSRMFQYERTQSRIGEDLWSAREKYINNSPLFFVDKITTPLLILHNDEDGAVPWYQGIELFVAMRRLEKPAWLLNYNGNPHWVMSDANRLDFAIRMQQFFDHYLKDAPEPEWMAVGLPAVDKGKKFALELLEPVKPEVEKEGETTAENGVEKD